MKTKRSIRLSAGYDVCCSQQIAKLSTMTQDAMVYKVILVSFYCFGSCCFFIVAQLELGLTPFTEDLGVSCPFTENSRTT